MVLIGLVSNGKSTLANALIGHGVLPTSNLVCTAMPVTVADPLEREALPGAVHIARDKETILDPLNLASAIEAWNGTGEGALYLRMPLSKLNHGQFPVAIVDTPGVNDGMDTRYSGLATKILRDLSHPTVLYVSHVRSCGTLDEEKCLMELADVMAEKNLEEWFVAINGWNFMDVECSEQNRKHYLDKVSVMAQKCGLPCPRVFFVAALPAELCIKYLEGGRLSREEEIELEAYLDSIDLHAKARANKRALGSISNKTLRTAMYCSGITPLERALFNHFQKNRKG